MWCYTLEDSREVRVHSRNVLAMFYCVDNWNIVVSLEFVSPVFRRPSVKTAERLSVLKNLSEMWNGLLAALSLNLLFVCPTHPPGVVRRRFCVWRQ